MSKKYAEGASGHIHGVTTTGKLWDTGTPWHNVEKNVVQDKLLTGEITKMSFNELTSRGTIVPLSQNYLNSLLRLQGESPL